LNRLTLQRSLILAVKVAVAIGLVAWLVLSGRLQLSRLASIRLCWPLVALFALVAGSLIIPAIRWWWLLRIQGLNEPLGKIFRLTWSGYMAALILPGAASGDLAKSYLILRDNSQARARAFSTVLADRFLGLHSLFFLGTLSAVWMTIDGRVGTGNQRLLLLATVVPLLLMTGCLFVLLCSTTRSMLFRFMPSRWCEAWNQSFSLYCEVLPSLAGCFCMSTVSSLMTVASFAAAGQAIGNSIPLDTALIAGPVIVVANCLPMTPGGIGIAEATSSELFGQFGSSAGAEIMILTRICSAMAALVGVIPVLASYSNKRMTQPELVVASVLSQESEASHSLQSGMESPRC
jgi:uncharacterized protein (TIRG00374 family)